MKSVAWLISGLSVLNVLASPETLPNHETWIIEGPWDTLPADASPTLRLDPEMLAITISTSLTDFEPLLDPDPSMGPAANAVRFIQPFAGRLYFGYGDLARNLGPVDALSFDPVRALLVREAEDLPEEALAGLSLTPDGRLLMVGEDARESLNFGNLFFRDVQGWHKLRTIPGGVHVATVVPGAARWYARYQARTPLPVDFPFVLVSTDQGASWNYEKVDSGTASLTLPLGITSGGDGNDYACLFVVPSDGGLDRQRLYLHDGTAWRRFVITVPEGQFLPQEILAFGPGILVRGGAFDASRKFVDSTHLVVDGVAREIPFLHDRFTPFLAAATHDGTLYLVEYPQGEFPYRPYTLHRTSTLEDWETLGEVRLLPGAIPLSLALSHGRMFVGAASLGGDPDPTAGYVLPAASIGPIEAASLFWDAEVPAGSTLALQARTGRTDTELAGRPFVGPDGTAGTSFTEAGRSLAPVHAGDTIIQVRVLKTVDPGGSPPLVRWIEIRDRPGTLVQAAERGQGLYGGRILAASGSYRSPIRALREPVMSCRVTVDAVTPGGESRVELRLRTAATAEELIARAFVGPDGTGDTSYGPGVANAWGGHDGDRFIQYEAVLLSGSGAHAPTLRRVAIETRGGRLEHLEVWTRFDEGELHAEARGGTAGDAVGVRVVALDAGGHRVAVDGEIELTAFTTGPLEPSDLQPTTARLAQGLGVARITVTRAGPTQVCARLGDITGCSAGFAVAAAGTARLEVETALPAPVPWWAPVGTAGAPFQLSVRALDRFGNSSSDYTGVVECRAWQERVVDPDGPPLLRASLLESDGGAFEADVAIDRRGEFNLVCRDLEHESIAGATAVVMD